MMLANFQIFSIFWCFAMVFRHHQRFFLKHTFHFFCFSRVHPGRNSKIIVLWNANNFWMPQTTSKMLKKKSNNPWPSICWVSRRTYNTALFRSSEIIGTRYSTIGYPIVLSKFQRKIIQSAIQNVFRKNSIFGLNLTWNRCVYLQISENYLLIIETTIMSYSEIWDWSRWSVHPQIRWYPKYIFLIRDFRKRMLK